MGVLTDLLNKVGIQAVPGTWNVGPVNLPDVGYTELVNTSTGKDTSNPTWNNPAVYKAAGGIPSTQNVQPFTNTARAVGALPQNSNTTYNPDTTYITIKGETKKASDWRKQGVDPNNPSGGGGGGTDNNALQTRLNGIMQRLNLMKGEGERLRGVAKNVRDEVVGNIGTKYQGVLNDAETKKTDSLAALDTADRGTVRDYANTQLQMDRTSEGVKLKNRLLARALGFGDSSYYLDTQSKNNNSLQTGSNQLGMERSDKLAGIKKSVADTNTWYGQKVTEIGQEKSMLEAQAEREYQDNISKSVLAEQNFGIDSADAAAQAESDYANKLGRISSYVQNKAAILNSVASAAGAQSSKIAARPNIDTGTASLLSKNDAQTGAQNMDWNQIPAPSGTLASEGGNRSLLSSKKKNPWDEYIYGNTPAMT